MPPPRGERRMPAADLRVAGRAAPAAAAEICPDGLCVSLAVIRSAFHPGRVQPFFTPPKGTSSMRTHRITGVVVSTAIVTALVGGALGTTSASADASRHHTLAGHPAVPSAPADASTIISQAKALGGLGEVASPVAKLVEDALATPMSTDTV